MRRSFFYLCILSIFTFSTVSNAQFYGEPVARSFKAQVTGSDGAKYIPNARRAVRLTDYLPAGYVTDGSADYATYAQNAIDAGESEKLPVIFDIPVLALGSELTVNTSATAVETDGYIKPYGTYSDYLLLFTTDVGGGSGNVPPWYANFYAKLRIDCNHQSRGIELVRVDHSKFMVNIDAAYGTAIKFRGVRESKIEGTVRRSKNRGEPVLDMTEPDEAPARDATNNVRLDALDIIYCAEDDYIKIGTENPQSDTGTYVVGKVRNITLNAPQIHYIDANYIATYEPTWSISNTTKLINIYKHAEKIEIIGGNVRLGDTSQGVAIAAGSTGEPVDYVKVIGTTITGEGNNATGILIESGSDGVGTIAANFALTGTGSANISGDAYETTGTRRVFETTATAKTAISNKVSYIDSNTVAPNHYWTITGDSVAHTQQIDLTTSSGRWNVTQNTNSTTLLLTPLYDSLNSDTDGELNLGNTSKRIGSIGIKPKTSAPTAYVGYCTWADRVTWDPASKGSGEPYLVCYDGAAWHAAW